MTESETKTLLGNCRGAGLAIETDKLALLAIRQREAAIALAKATENFQKNRARFVALAQERGIDVPQNISAEEIANALA